MRLIDADALTRRFKVRGCFNKETLGYMVAKVINSAPTVDAVEVVRCKDCAHYEYPNTCHCHKADENGTPIFVRDDDFCSYGERKEGTENGKESKQASKDMR